MSRYQFAPIQEGDLLLALGLDGLKQVVLHYKKEAERLGQEVDLYTGMEMAIDTLSEVCLSYDEEAMKLEQEGVSNVLSHIAHS